MAPMSASVLGRISRPAGDGAGGALGAAPGGFGVFMLMVAQWGSAEFIMGGFGAGRSLLTKVSAYLQCRPRRPQGIDCQRHGSMKLRSGERCHSDLLALSVSSCGG